MLLFGLHRQQLNKMRNRLVHIITSKKPLRSYKRPILCLGKKQNKKRQEENKSTKSVTISDAAGKAKLKDGVGTTGVEFRFYKKGEYNKLSDAQKEELREHNKVRKDKNASQKSASSFITEKGKPTKSLTKIISQVIAETGKKNEEDESAELLTNFLTNVATTQAAPGTNNQTSSLPNSSMPSAQSFAL